MGKRNDDKEHLPLYGVGPIIVFGQFIITLSAIVLSYCMNWDFAKIELLRIPLKGLGIPLMIFGVYLDISAKYRSKLFDKIAENKLITDGIYAIVRNPVYGGVLIGCTGAVLMTNNLLLLAVPPICWVYVTVFVICTEEKWLKNRYKQEYVDYCKRVNRCIPWFPKKQ